MKFILNRTKGTKIVNYKINQGILVATTFSENINFEKIYYYLLLTFAFTLPLSRATNNLFIGILILLFVVQGEYKKQFFILKKSNLAITIILFILFTVFSLLWTGNLYVGLDGKLLYLYWLAIFPIALNVKVNKIFSIISAFILGMIVSEILSYGMFFEFWTINNHGKEYPSPFMMHIDYSIFLAVTALILLNRLLSFRYSIQEKLVLLFFFITISGNLFINDGRTGQVSFIVGIFATVFLHYKFNFKSILTAILLITVIFTAAYQFSEKFQIRVAAAKSDIINITKGNLSTSLGVRLATYSVATDIFIENPLIGVGVGDFTDAASDALYKNNHGFEDEIINFIPKYHFHSQYLNVLVQGGIIGLFLLISIFYQFIKLRILEPELKELSLLIGIVFLIGFIPEPLLMKQFTNTLFIFFAGLFLGASLSNSKLTKKDSI